MAHRRHTLVNERFLLWGLTAILLLWAFAALRASGLLEILKKIHS
jgi:hypothetical protein